MQELRLASTGAVQDSGISSLNVRGIAEVSGSLITLGDFGTDVFNAQSITANSLGAVTISENSDMNLHGFNRAATMSLVADGMITDSATADIVVSGLMHVSGSLINLGTESTDRLEANTLTFLSADNTNINMDSDVRLAGNSLAGDQLLLTADGNITDVSNADTRAENRAVFTADNVIVGDSFSDCFEVNNGGTQ